MATAFQEPALGQSFVFQGTISSQIDPLPGHANEYVAAVLTPRGDNAVYSGVLNFTASEGVNVEIWHAYTPGNSTPIPNTANYNGMPVAVVDLSSCGAAGSVPFSGNAVVLHGSSPFTVTYTVNAVAEAGQTSGNNFTQSQPTCGSNTGTNWIYVPKFPLHSLPLAKL